jgi:hypothetical protein
LWEHLSANLWHVCCLLASSRKHFEFFIFNENSFLPPNLSCALLAWHKTYEQKNVWSWGRKTIFTEEIVWNLWTFMLSSFITLHVSLCKFSLLFCLWSGIIGERKYWNRHFGFKDGFLIINFTWSSWQVKSIVAICGKNLVNLLWVWIKCLTTLMKVIYYEVFILKYF